jgi:tetratricopeptide (TPR) repeat protein
MNWLGSVYDEAGRWEEAIPLLEKALAMRREKLGAEDLYTLSSMNSLGRAYDHAGRSEEAIPLLEQALAMRREKIGAEHPDTLRSMKSLAKAYETVDRIKDTVQLWLRNGVYYDALQAARHADHELMTMLIDNAIAQDIAQVRAARDRVVVGELRLLAGHRDSAVAAIQAGFEGDTPFPFMHKSLGMALFAQGKTDEAQAAFRQALAARHQEDGTFKLEGADTIEMTAAYYLDLISQDDYTAITKDSKADACFPWFYVGQRKEFEKDREAALAAYKRSVELGDDETANPIRGLSKWKFVELTKASVGLP